MAIRRTRSGRILSRCSPGSTRSPLRGCADVDRRPGHARPAPTIPIEERDPARDHRRGSRLSNPAFDVTPAASITAIVTERGIHRAPYDALARRRRWLHEGGRSRRRVRHPSPAADRRRRRSRSCPSEAVRSSTGSWRDRRGRRGRRDPRRHEQPFCIRFHRAGRRPGSSSTTTARARTRTGSARSGI